MSQTVCFTQDITQPEAQILSACHKQFASLRILHNLRHKSYRRVTNSLLHPGYYTTWGTNPIGVSQTVCFTQDITQPEAQILSACHKQFASSRILHNLRHKSYRRVTNSLLHPGYYTTWGTNPIGVSQTVCFTQDITQPKVQILSACHKQFSSPRILHNLRHKSYRRVTNSLLHSGYYTTWGTNPIGVSQTVCFTQDITQPEAQILSACHKQFASSRILHNLRHKSYRRVTNSLLHPGYYTTWGTNPIGVSQTICFTQDITQPEAQIL